MAEAPDFIPNDQFLPDGPGERMASSHSSQSPDFIPNSEFVPDGGAPEQSGDESFLHQAGQSLISAERGLESGLTGGLSDYVASKYRNKLEGTTNEEVKANEEAHPIAHAVGEIGGTIGLLEMTGGLGLAAPKGAGLLAKMASNAAQGALISGAHSVSNDAAFGDPNLAASKILSHAGTAAGWGGLFGGVTSAVLSVPGIALDALAGKVASGAAKDLSVAPEALSPLNQIRMGIARGLQNPEAEKAIAGEVSSGLEALHKVSSIEDLGALSGDASAPEIEAFQNAKTDFIKEFGNSKGTQIDPDEIISFITNPASKNSTQQTLAFNHYLKAIKGLSNLKLDDSNLSRELQNAQGALRDWQQELAAASQTAPHLDIEYGGPAHAEGSSIDANLGAPKPYSTKFDLPPGETITPNYSEGVTIGEGPEAARVASFGSEQASPFDKPLLGFSLDKIQTKIRDFRTQVSSLLEKQASELMPSAEEIKEAASDAKGLGNRVQNLRKATEAIDQKPPPLGAGFGVAASHVPYGPQLLTLFSAVRNYAGDGGLYRLGRDIASAQKVLSGTANVLKKVDDRIGDKARLIFTGASSQARKINDE